MAPPRITLPEFIIADIGLDTRIGVHPNKWLLRGAGSMVHQGLRRHFHLATVINSAAQADFELGRSVNFDDARGLLERVRAKKTVWYPLPGFALISTTDILASAGNDPGSGIDRRLAVDVGGFDTEKAFASAVIIVNLRWRMNELFC